MNGQKDAATVMAAKLGVTAHRLRATGMPIRQMKRCAELREQGERSVADRLSMLVAHQDNLRDHIAQVQESDEALTRKIAAYRAKRDELHELLRGHAPVGSWKF